MTTRRAYILSILLAVAPLLPQVRYDCRMSGRRAMTVCCCDTGDCRDDPAVEVEDERPLPCCDAGDGPDESSDDPESPQPDDDNDGAGDLVPTRHQCCDVRLASSQVAAVADSKPARQAAERTIVHLLAIPPLSNHGFIALRGAERYRLLLMHPAGSSPERPRYLRHCALLI